MITRNLLWREIIALKALHGPNRKTSNQVAELPYIKDLLDRGFLKEVSIGSKRGLEANPQFHELFERELAQAIRHHETTLQQLDIVNHASRYTEEEIQVLSAIASQKDEILSAQMSKRKISSTFFKNQDSKHLDNHSGLSNAVLKILGRDDFPGQDPKDQQFLFVLHTVNVRAIVISENIEPLKTPWVPRSRDIELWHPGGNNFNKLKHVPQRSEPKFYLCDWDHDGLHIYERILVIFPELVLLIPDGHRKPVTTGHHKSAWQLGKPWSGLNPACYSSVAFQIIDELMKQDQWIEQEGNDFGRMADQQIPGLQLL